MTNPDAPNVNLTYDERLKMLEMEAATMEDTPKSMANKIFERGLVGAALQVVTLAERATNERIRLAASQYVVERNLGRVQDAVTNGGQDPLDQFLDKLFDKSE
jgi:hypothetical protein